MKPNYRRLELRMRLGALMIVGAFAPISTASTITPNLNLFTLTNLSADGSVNVSVNSFVLYGGNTGSGVPGTTEFTSISAVSGTVLFNYSYVTDDVFPGYDSVGYILGDSRVFLANENGQGSSGSFSILSGQRYGFYAATLDNQGEPGVLTVVFPSAPSSVPEPASLILLLMPVIVLLLRGARHLSPLRGLGTLS